MRVLKIPQDKEIMMINPKLTLRKMRIMILRKSIRDKSNKEKILRPAPKTKTISKGVTKSRLMFL